MGISSSRRRATPTSSVRIVVAFSLLASNVCAWQSSIAGPKLSGATTAVASDGRVFQFGGLDERGAATAACWTFADGAWTELATTGGGPGPVMYAAGAVQASPRREEFVVCGGWDPGARGSGGSFEDSVWSLDTSSLAWTREDPLPCGPVSRHGAAAVGDRVFVHTFRGGVLRRDACGVLKAHATTGDAPEGLSMCATAGVDGGLLVFGGATKGGDFSGDAYVLDAKTYAWRRLAVAPGAARRRPRQLRLRGPRRRLVFSAAGARAAAASPPRTRPGSSRSTAAPPAGSGSTSRARAARRGARSPGGVVLSAAGTRDGRDLRRHADARRRVSLAPS
ncbi:hypothetical protein JL722_4782 [Aureococcus anophagefferens]|nr:hypothetical protein JL722_4782 [Aureococcus anophagefferens]